MAKYNKNKEIKLWINSDKATLKFSSPQIYGEED
jgi:hypothetical protein